MDNPLLTKNKKSSQEIIFTILRQKSYLKLYKKYSSNKFSFNTICINNMIYNEACLIVSKFKDYLILDDNTEFLRKLYLIPEINYKLKKILDLYENYSKIFPNYLVVKERKFMYKNIRKKQKMIDNFNQIKSEEEENRRKIKEKQEDNNNEDKKFFTDLVKDEIKVFQKDNNINKYKNSFDSENDVNNNDTLFGQSHGSISINIINKKELLSSPNKIGSADSKNNETNETISGLLNIMNDSKIYINDLPNIFKVNYSPNKGGKIKNNIIEKKIITFKKNKNNSDKEKIKDNKTIKNNNSNNNILQKFVATPKKKKKELNKPKNYFHFNSTLLAKKRIKMLNPALIDSNSTSINKAKFLDQKQKIYIPSIGNTIININNNFFSEISKTERSDSKKKNRLASINANYKTIQNSSSDKVNKLKTNKLLLLSNNKNNKYKQICRDYSYKKKSELEKNNKIAKNKIIINDIRKLSPQIWPDSSIVKTKNDRNFNIIDKKKDKNEMAKISITKGIKNSEEKKKNKKIEKNKGTLFKNNKHLLTFKSNERLSIIDYSSVSLLNIAKTDSNLIKKISNNIAKKPKSKKLKEKQKTCFNFIKNKNLEKEITIQDNFYDTYRNSIEKNKSSKEEKDLIIREKKPNKSHKSIDNYKAIKRIHSIKNKILKSETRYPFKKFITHYMNEAKPKNSTSNINNFIDYSTISGANKNKRNLLLPPKSAEKKKKCESIDFSNNEYYKHHTILSKMDSTKRNSYVYSPKYSFSNFLNSNREKRKLTKFFFQERPLFNQTIIPKQYLNTISKNDIRSKYKYIILTKNNKKSYDFNSEIQKKYKQNILSKINNLKNINSNVGRIKKNSYSIDLNNSNNKTYSNYFNCKNNKSKEKYKKSDSQDLFKKIMSYKIGIKNKKEEKRAKINNTNNNLPLTIRVNTSNFLSKIKEKYKMNDNKKK